MWLLWKCRFGRVIIPVCVSLEWKKNGFKLVHTASQAWLQNHFSALSATVIFSPVVITLFCPPLLKANVMTVISCFYPDYPLSFKARAIFHPYSILVHPPALPLATFLFTFPIFLPLCSILPLNGGYPTRVRQYALVLYRSLSLGLSQIRTEKCSPATLFPPSFLSNDSKDLKPT